MSVEKVVSLEFVNGHKMGFDYAKIKAAKIAFRFCCCSEHLETRDNFPHCKAVLAIREMKP